MIVIDITIIIIMISHNGIIMIIIIDIHCHVENKLNWQHHALNL